MGHVRYINILTWLRGFQVKPLYLVLLFLYLSLFWELRDKGNLKNLQFWPESLGAMFEYWYIERGLFPTCSAKNSGSYACSSSNWKGARGKFLENWIQQQWLYFGERCAKTDCANQYKMKMAIKNEDGKCSLCIAAPSPQKKSARESGCTQPRLEKWYFYN